MTEECFVQLSHLSNQRLPDGFGIALLWMAGGPENLPSAAAFTSAAKIDSPVAQILLCLQQARASES